MMHIAEAKNRMVASQIKEWRDIIIKIDDIIAEAPALTDSDLKKLNAVKAGLENRITVYRAAL